MSRLLSLWTMVAVAACSAGSCPSRNAVPAREETMSKALSPAGDPHPGEIVHEDRINGRTWTVQAHEVPQSIAWVRVDDRWEPVLRIEMTGTPEQRRITKFGREGRMLETTIQAPPPMPRP